MRQGRTTGEADRAQVARTDDDVRPDAYGWLPVSSAPRDQWVLISHMWDGWRQIPLMAMLDRGQWTLTNETNIHPSAKVTHWQPLPYPPEGSE